MRLRGLSVAVSAQLRWGWVGNKLLGNPPSHTVHAKSVRKYRFILVIR